MPCYCSDVVVLTTYPKGCSTSVPSPYTLPLSSENVYYSGANLPYTGIQTTDLLTVAIQKIDAKLSPEEITNAVIAAIEADDMLRAALCAALNC
mgnify:FL=1